MKKKIIFSFGLVVLFTLLISSQLHRPIFADECPLSCPISGPITGPITGSIITPTDTPTETPNPTVSVEPSVTVTITPTPTQVDPTPTSITHHHGDYDFEKIFRRFLSFEDVWKRFLQFFGTMNMSEKKHMSLAYPHRQVAGISSSVKYIADNSCAETTHRNYSRFDF